MKKFLALLLTLLMVLSLGTLALADHVDCDDVTGGTCELDTMYDPEFHMQPGEKYYFAEAMFGHAIVPKDDASDDPDVVDMILGSGADYRVSASWDIGGAMVKGVKFDKDAESEVDDGTGNWYLELNENYTISELKWLKGTLTFTSKKDKTKVYKYYYVGQVSNHKVIVDGYKKAADAEDDPIAASNNTLYKCSEDNPGYVAFNGDGYLLSCTLKMLKNEQAFMYNDESMIDDVEEKYGDTDARIDCYNFGGAPKFTNDAAFKLQADYADQYKIYTWDGTKLTPKKDYKWDSINGVYTWTTKTPTAYVISDKELIAGAETADTADKTTKNPDTGANDVVGVAAALAVVSLAAAAAVSLRK